MVIFTLKFIYFGSPMFVYSYWSEMYRKRNKETVKAYSKWYYKNKVKPTRKMKPPQVKVRCVYCGMLHSPSEYDRVFNMDVFLKFGSRFQNVKSMNSEDVQSMTGFYIKHVVDAFISKSIGFLKWCVDRDFVSEEFLSRMMFKPNVAQYSDVPSVPYVPSAYVPSLSVPSVSYVPVNHKPVSNYNPSYSEGVN